jgi:hypothetical protein
LKLLLTSGGVTNTSIRDALVDLLGKPIDESRALCIPTAQWGQPMCGPALGIVDFSIFPHLFLWETHTMAAAEQWAADIAGPAYAIDDQTAIKVVDGTVEVVSEGHWKLFTRSAVATESGF